MPVGACSHGSGRSAAMVSDSHSLGVALGLVTRCGSSGSVLIWHGAVDRDVVLAFHRFSLKIESEFVVV